MGPSEIRGHGTGETEPGKLNSPGIQSLPDEPRFKAVWGETVLQVVSFAPAALLLVREPEPPTPRDD